MHPDRVVSGPETATELLGFDPDRLGKGEVKPVENGTLRHLERCRTLGVLGRLRNGVIEQGVGVVNRADDSVDERLLGADMAAGVHHLFRECHPGQSCEALGTSSPGNESKLDLGEADTAVFGDHAEVRGERNLQSAPECIAVHRRNRDLRELLDGKQALVEGLGEGLGRRNVETGEFGDVGASGEYPSAPGDDYRANRRVTSDLGGDRSEVTNHVGADRIHLRTLKSDDSNTGRRVAFEVDVLSHDSVR